MPALAESVTAWAELTEAIVAEKLAEAAPAATVTEAGTATAELVLARFTVRLLLAAPFSVTVHASVPAPVMDALVQDKADNVACTGLLPVGVRNATICMIHEPEALSDAVAV